MIETENKTGHDDAPSTEDYATAKWALTAVNFFVETNRLEPYAAVYLIDIAGWNEVNFGVVSLVMNVAMVLFQTPAGDLLDKTTTSKKYITTAAIVVAALTTVMVVWTSNFWAVLLGKTVEGITATIFLPALMTLLLGISKTEAEVPSLIATTEVSNKVGSFLIVCSCAAIAYFAYPRVEAMFYLLGVGGLAAAFFTILIPEKAIDHERARQLGGTDTDKDDGVEITENGESDTVDEERKQASPSRYMDLFRNKAIVLFAVLTFTYHLANAGPAPLLAVYVAKITPDDQSLTWTSAVMIFYFLPQALTSYLMSFVVDRFDHKKIMVVAFVTVPLRCFLLAVLVEYFNNPWALTLMQAFEGIGAGVYDVMIPILVQKMTRGSGRFGFTFGFIVSMWRIGHGCSVLLGETIVQWFGYTTAFSVLGTISVLNLIGFVLFFKIKTDANDKAEEVTDMRTSLKSTRSDRSLSNPQRVSIVSVGVSSRFLMEFADSDDDEEPPSKRDSATNRVSIVSVGVSSGSLSESDDSDNKDGDPTEEVE